MSTIKTESVSLQVKTSEGDIHNVPLTILNHFGMIKSMLESLEFNVDDVIPLNHVRGECFQLIMSWIVLQIETESRNASVNPDNQSPSTEVRKRLSIEEFNHNQQINGSHCFGHQPSLNDVQDAVHDRRVKIVPEADQQFIDSLSRDQIFELIEACNYLQLELLYQYLSKTIAGWLSKLTVEEIWEQFNVKTDFNNREDDEIKRENDWIEEDIDQGIQQLTDN